MQLAIDNLAASQPIELDAAGQKSWAKIVVRAWFDSDFAGRLAANPVEVCNDAGLSLPEGTEVRVPPAPAELGDIDQLSDKMGIQALFCCCC